MLRQKGHLLTQASPKWPKIVVLIIMFSSAYSDLQGNNITVIYESDFQHLTKLRIL